MKREISRLLTILAVLLLGLGASIAKTSALEPDGNGNYPIWVGETQVLESNKENVLGDAGTPTVVYNPETNTLTFDGLTKTVLNQDLAYFLNYKGEDLLTLEIKGTNSIEFPAHGIGGELNSIVFTGTGTLTLKGTRTAVHHFKDIKIEENCTVNVVTENAGFEAHNSFNCAGTVKVTGTNPEAVGVVAEGKITITGSITTEGIVENGIYSASENAGVVIDGGTVNVSGIYSDGAIEIVNGSKVTSDVKLPDGVEEWFSNVHSIYTMQGITIKSSTVTATSMLGSGIYCEKSDGGGKITIENSAVVAKAVPEEEETADGTEYYCQGFGIFMSDGPIIITDSEVTTEGFCGILADQGDVTITGGTIKANATAFAECPTCGIFAGYDDTLKITDATVIVDSIRNGLEANGGSIFIYGGNLECKAVFDAIMADTVCFKESSGKAPVVDLSTKEDEDGNGIDANDVLIEAGEITIKGGYHGIKVISLTPEGDGLTITNGITKVTVEGRGSAVEVILDNEKALAIELGDEVVIKEPEGGKLSDDATGFVDENNEDAKKVVLVKECSITFDANGGTGTMDGSSVEPGTEYELPACGFTAPKGQVFDGWLVGDSVEAVEVGTKITVTSSIVIKPQWTKIVYKITKGADGTWKEGDGAYEIIVETEPDPSVCWPNYLSMSWDGTGWTDGTEYDASEGSTKILIKEATLKPMAEGKHDIVIAFKDAEVATTLTIQKEPADDGGDEDENNGTDDDNNGETDGGDDDNNGGNNGGTDGGNGTVESPKTGDSLPYAAFLLLAVIAGAGIGAGVIFRRRSERA